METNMAATPHSFFLSFWVSLSLFKMTEITIIIYWFVDVDYLVLYIKQN